MAIWAIADLHLSFATRGKGMDLFGPEWAIHFEKVRQHWLRCITSDDLVLLAGDLSWAKKFDEAHVDLTWLHLLPGTKVIIRGNHDYWWTSIEKMKKSLPSSIHIVQNNHFLWKDIAIGGARLWDTPEFNFAQYTIYKENPKENTQQTSTLHDDEKIFTRELGRLRLSLESMPANVQQKIVMTHYPPLSADLKDSQASQLLEQYQVDTCVFGHLHSLDRALPMFGEKNGVKYVLTSCDYLNFCPILVRD